MFRITVPRIIFGCIMLYAAYAVNSFLAPIEQRLDKMAKAADAAGITAEPVDIEKVCGVLEPGLPPDQMQARVDCYSKETQKQLDQMNTVLKAGDLPTLGSTEPCRAELFQIVGDEGVGSKLITALWEKKTAEAHAMLSRQMQSQVSEAELTDYIDKLLWRGKTIVGAQGIGSGSTSGDYICEGKTMVPVTHYEFTLNDDVATKAAVESVQEDGAIKIRAIKRIDGSATKDPAQAPLPDAKRVSELAREAMHAFIVDTSGSEINLLYSGTSMYLRSETSRSVLTEKFKPYFGKYEFMAIANKPIEITSPPTAAVMENGFPVFDVSGIQMSTAGPINFKMKFAYDGDWSLANLDIRSGN